MSEVTQAQVGAVLHQMATFQDGNAQPHTIALINEMADLLQTFAAMQADAAPDALAVINRIAEVSSAFACQAGVSGVETAGSIISFLATNPQRIHDFMSGGSIIDWPISWQRAGCLSWQGMDGKIHWPGEGNIQ